MDRWMGRVAVVTGASNATGSLICMELVKHGLAVIGCGDNTDKIREKLDESAQDYMGMLHTIKCDLINHSEIISMFEEIKNKFGHVDVCINITGFDKDNPLLMAPNNAWRSMLEVNVSAFATCTLESVKLMTKKGVDEGVIINIDGIGGRVLWRNTVRAKFNYYNGSKSWVQYLSQSMRRELRHKNNRIRLWSIGTKEVDMTFLANLDPITACTLLKTMQELDSGEVVKEVTRILEEPPHTEVDDVLLQPSNRET